MADYLCHAEPLLLAFEAQVRMARPAGLLLDRSALHPGGGGQVCDAAIVEWDGGSARITGVQVEGGLHWHILDGEVALQPGQRVSVRIDAHRRATVSRLHTATHILNALVFQSCEGALVTGAQINADGTARMDFDLPDFANDALRALEIPLNEAIQRGLEVRTAYVTHQEARATHGLIRSLSVAPPPTQDGRIRIVEIAGLDRQACGGTHVANTAECGRVLITKIENKGRQNRRVRLVLAD
jgi:misacylated tRNA(Ala) deacylase